MKKKLAFALCTALMLCSMSVAALAAEPMTEADTVSTMISAADTLPGISAYPAEVRASEENGVYRLEKVYYLTAKDDPTTIPTADFEREGRTYTLLDLLKNDPTETDTREHIEVVTLESKTKDMAEILKMLEPKLEVKIGVTAPGAIAGFTVTIDSPALTAEMLATVGLATELNLVNPGSMAEALGALGFPSGEAVSGKTALTFDISKLVPMIAQIYNETSDHKFILKVTDAKGKSTTKTLTCHLTGKVALAYNNDADLWANTATVTAANVPDGGSVQYRVKGAADWTDAVLVEGSKYRLAPVYETSKNAAGLDVHTIKAGTGVFAATTYEVRIAKDGQAVDSKEFATAAGDKIPNGDMSGWSKKQMTTDGKTFWPITYPNAEGNSVWDSGNNMFLEQYNDDGTPTIFTPLCRQDETEPGTARLQARMVLGFVFAPGNMFTGNFDYSGFSGTVNFGKPYAWTARPRALKVRYKAQIGKIDKVGSYDPDGASYQDKQDCARIFVAVVNWKAQHGVTSGMTAPTGMWDPATAKSLDEGAILGYGDLVITQTATGWIEATLPFNWYAKDAANPASAPFSLVISCATSMRGDYLTGCSTNTMQVDDFEWAY